jgi:hypothetical protein
MAHQTNRSDSLFSDAVVAFVAVVGGEVEQSQVVALPTQSFAPKLFVNYDTINFSPKSKIKIIKQKLEKRLTFLNFKQTFV